MTASNTAAVLNRPLSNTNILAEKTLISPDELRSRYPRSEKASQTIEAGRASVEAILDGEDKRILVVVGPCSIHDVDTAKEYAERLMGLREKVSDRIEVVMRVYFEKPRTTVGWKGLINDPHLDDSFDIETGLSRARELLVWLADRGMPTGTEALDPISPQYLSDLFTWSAIGARTTESQTHREMSSGLSTAVGFKNGTDGGLTVAVNAMQSAANPHSFLGIDSKGQATVLKTRGNAYGHVILRGGNEGPNYDSVNVSIAEEAMSKAGLPLRIMIDCSHANANKDHKRQPLVAHNVADQLAAGNDSIIGIMLESHLHAGNQSLKDPKDLVHGVSITDACIDWETTEKLMMELHGVLAARVGK
ncbi:3-deoxy-7-phosphoheptulonate synthase [Granulosicoccus antarcticus]|uniref:Phospho-2-dehydro-3-deoxyheptonate aldolase n=1 Tax=Granulosicoccus antarcticus IMCC3135 TaxID=1192854 RepID=A0A2Z2NSN6_9GAMM|nr:3-deoxy-7-phosphoheptulonate synthase [Granulosicoccus antarcticus]ASJ74522.1 Phospho-2-dehydro-3-deoxyheptonate aldolase, Tyr-sensitive [Granulosicoccus antarcticus IMCC3135]